MRTLFAFACPILMGLALGCGDKETEDDDGGGGLMDNPDSGATTYDSGTGDGGEESGTEPVDADGDGYDTDSDCDDDNANVYPGAIETCNGIDDDCDDEVDEGVGDVYYEDADDDGFGNIDSTAELCEAEAGWVEDATDCDDESAETYPGADEVCDDADNDCDDEVDEDLYGTYYDDADGDGYGDDDTETETCAPSSTAVDVPGDCDDTDATIYPEAEDACDDDIDQDCDGVDDGCNTGWETLDHAFLLDEPGVLNCELYWSAVYTPVTSHTCRSCDFVFDVALTYDASASEDDGTCTSLGVDTTWVYGYIDDYYGYGAYLAIGYSGYYYAWAPANWDETTKFFDYGAGLVDYYYPGGYYYSAGYYTHYYQGWASLEIE